MELQWDQTGTVEWRISPMLPFANVSNLLIISNPPPPPFFQLALEEHYLNILFLAPWLMQYSVQFYNFLKDHSLKIILYIQSFSYFIQLPIIQFQTKNLALLLHRINLKLELEALTFIKHFITLASEDQFVA